MDFTRIFSLWDEQVDFRRTGDITREDWRGESFLRVDSETLALLAEEAFHDAAFYLRATRLEKIAAILRDPQASANDRSVATALLKNACIAAEGRLPLCQDTGTATVIAWKGEKVLSGGNDEEALSRGALAAYAKNCLRYSQVFPSSMCGEANTGTNLPAQTDIYAAPGDEYRFLFVAKGGGSSNKTAFFQQSKALLTGVALEKFIREKLRSVGVAACPPYRLALVVGGLSPEMNLKTLKLATTGFLDRLPGYEAGAENAAFLDAEWSARLLEAAQATGLGAQFGGKYFALDAVAIRLPRHAASCPVSLGVSCNADRNILAKITPQGVFLENLERSPERFLAAAAQTEAAPPPAARINLKQPMAETLRGLSRLKAGERVLLNGPVVVARDMAHARLFEMLKSGNPPPAYFRDHPVYYAGPAKTPEGCAIGSFGPTTAQRMDSYLPDFMAAGFSLVSLAKGERSPAVTAACKKYGGFYLGTPGGPAALLAAENIVRCEVLDFPELGMEAVYRIEVRDFPAFVLSDDKGNDFYAGFA
ncbi:MAG: FumA C-terminus/TtdB family hydratase beta subunit [Spirochaetaceae bacterium]|nr:FumA C-terminus/TtdB family hydratase beta subunit [Spirochaetaceae bacterium]